MRQLFLSISGLFFCQMLLAQVTFPEMLQPEKKTPLILHQLEVNQDPRLEKMLDWHIESNKKRNGTDGFRVDIFSSSDLNAKEKALQKKVEFLSKYPDQNAYILFIAPNFRVRIGDFRTKNEALKMYKKIQGTYPAAFIVQDKIDFPMVKPTQYE
jgi:hypothetical protein